MNTIASEEGGNRKNAAAAFVLASLSLQKQNKTEKKDLFND
jgi:hypothetical protein